MAGSVEIWEEPKAEVVNMIVGWRQWADAGSVSSGLPEYLIKRSRARLIGRLNTEGYYLFQIPGTHDLVRPVIKYKEGYPVSLQTQKNEFYYTGDEQRGLVIFIGDEPHLDVERYVASVLEAARALNVKRIIGLGGVYGELPYDKERMVSSTYSLPRLKDELADLAVNLSDYHGGASIGSVLAKRAGDTKVEYVAFYAFVPAYDFSNVAKLANIIRIENDYMAWLGIMQRINHMLKLGMDLSDLTRKTKRLIKVFDAKVEELDNNEPQLGFRDYLNRLDEEYVETPFSPLDDVWEEEINRLLDKFDSEE